MVKKILKRAIGLTSSDLLNTPHNQLDIFTAAEYSVGNGKVTDLEQPISVEKFYKLQ
jgi:hypothetical protein